MKLMLESGQGLVVIKNAQGMLHPAAAGLGGWVGLGPWGWQMQLREQLDSYSPTWVGGHLSKAA